MDFPILKKIEKALRKSYHLEEFMDNAIAISFKEGEPNFAMIIIEEDDPDTINYSVAVDAPDPFSIADIALRLMHISKTVLAEPFYSDSEGDLFWSAEAYQQHQASLPGADEDDDLLLQMESPSKLPN